MTNSLERLSALIQAAEPRPWGYYDERTMEDEELLVALVNAAPELLAVVRAASSIEECDQGNEGVRATWGALAALESKLQEVLG